MTLTFSIVFLINLYMNIYPQLKPVENVDLNRYAGKWYEIASYPQRFQRGCNCTTAEYTITDKGYVTVYNKCKKNSPQGKTSSITGKAFPVKGSNNAKLKVQFFWPFRGDYWIIDLADDYSFAVVGTPDRKSLWIVSRKLKIEQEQLNQILSRIKDKQFNLDLLKYTNQDCGE